MSKVTPRETINFMNKIDSAWNGDAAKVRSLGRLGSAVIFFSHSSKTVRHVSKLVGSKTN